MFGRSFLKSDQVRAIGFFFLMGGIFWGRFLFGNQALFHDTLFKYFFPYAVFLKKSIQTLQWPFWNPHIYSGTPFLANPDSGVFYPFNALYVLFSYPKALVLTLWLHATVGGTFMYMLSREEQRSFGASLLSGSVYAFNGFIVEHYASPQMFDGYTWLPLILFFLKKTTERRSHYLFLAAGALALQVFAGHPQFVFYTGLALLIYGLSQTDFKDEPRLIVRTWLWIGFVVLLAGLYASAQLLPTAHFALESVRRIGKGFDWSTAYSLRPNELLKMTFIPLWNRLFVPTSGDPNVVSFYFGWPLSVLAVIGFASRSKESKSESFYAALSLIGLLLSLGRYVPGYRFLFEALPPLRIFRFPAQALFLTCFGVSGLAGYGFDRLRLNVRWKAGILALVLADLFLFSTRAIATIDDRFYSTTTPTIDFLKQHEGRFMLTPRTRLVDRRFGRTKLEAGLKFIDTAVPNLAMVFGLYDADGNIELRFSRYERVLNEVDTNPLSPWLNLLSVRYLFSFWDNLPNNFRLVRREPFFIFENPSALPRAYLVPEALSLNEEETFSYLKNHPAHNFRKSVIINSPSAASVGSASGSLEGQVTGLATEPNSVALDVHASKPAWLVLSDSFDSGWSAEINERPVTVYQANVVQRAVHVESGESKILFRYRAPWFLLGMLISLLAVSASILVTVVRLRRKT